MRLSMTDWARRRIAEGAKDEGRSLEEIDIMPAGMIVVDENGDLARRRVRSRMANRAHHNFRFTMETVPEGEAAGVAASDEAGFAEESLVVRSMANRLSNRRACVDRLLP